MLEPSTGFRLEYRLAEADICHYCSAGRFRKCWRSCRGRKVALLILATLGGFLVGTIFHAHGVRSGAVALGTTLLILVTLAWIREAWIERRVLRLARQMGLPRDLRLVISPEGIAEVDDRENTDPSRIFAWSEVVDVSRVDHLTVIRLRPAGGVLIVPDGAFASVEDRSHFDETLRSWRPLPH